MADPIPMTPLMSRREALAEVESQSDGALTMRELPCATQITLRVSPGSAAGDAAATAIGGALPTEPNTVCRHGPLDVLWMGPDEWLLVSQELSADQLQRLLRPARGATTAAVDVSAQRTIVELGGAAARAVLARGCKLDLHESRLGVGSCAQTLLARAQVILQPIAEPSAVRIFVRASFADYLADWLLDAGLEERLGAAVTDADEDLALPAA